MITLMFVRNEPTVGYSPFHRPCRHPDARETLRILPYEPEVTSMETGVMCLAPLRGAYNIEVGRRSLPERKVLS
jgi:hypothetical protein